MENFEKKSDQLLGLLGVLGKAIGLCIILLILYAYSAYLNSVQAQTFTHVYALQSEVVIDGAQVNATTLSFATSQDIQVVRELYMYEGFEGDSRHDGMMIPLEVDTIQADSGQVYLVTEQLPKGYKAVWIVNGQKYTTTRPTFRRITFPRRE